MVDGIRGRVPCPHEKYRIRVYIPYIYICKAINTYTHDSCWLYSIPYTVIPSLLTSSCLILSLLDQGVLVSKMQIKTSNLQSFSWTLIQPDSVWGFHFWGRTFKTSCSDQKQWSSPKNGARWASWCCYLMQKTGSNLVEIYPKNP